MKFVINLEIKLVVTDFENIFETGPINFDVTENFKVVVI